MPPYSPPDTVVDDAFGPGPGVPPRHPRTKRDKDV